jgi:hypothetical protein
MPPKRKSKAIPISDEEAKVTDWNELIDSACRTPGYIDMVVAADVFKALAKARSMYKAASLPAPAISIVHSTCVSCLQDTILVKLPTGTYCDTCGTAGHPGRVEPP